MVIEGAKRGLKRSKITYVVSKGLLSLLTNAELTKSSTEQKQMIHVGDTTS